MPGTGEAFWDGHVSAFAFLGGLPQSILYDNAKLAVARILTTAGFGESTPSRSFSPSTGSTTERRREAVSKKCRETTTRPEKDKNASDTLTCLET